MNSDFLSLNQAAALLGVHRDTLTRWEREGILVPGKIGGRRFYSRSALMAAAAPPVPAPAPLPPSTTNS